MKRIARALHADDAAQGVFDLARDHGAPTALKDIGVSATDLDVALDLALKNPYWNPRPVERTPLRALLEAAFEGRRPD
jgi:maleylacetate reductase